MAYAHRVLRLDGAPAADTSTALRAAARALPAAGARVRVRAFPNTDARMLADGLMSAAGDASKEAALAAGGATHVLDIATVYGTTYHSLWSLSCDAAPPMDPPALSSRLQAAMGPGGEAAQCRAYYKMAEASERRMVARGVVARPGWLCADVGASPGGWTQWLCHEITHAREVAVAEGAQDDASGHVWAIDPAGASGKRALARACPANERARARATLGERASAHATLGALADMARALATARNSLGAQSSSSLPSHRTRHTSGSSSRRARTARRARSSRRDSPRAAAAGSWTCCAATPTSTRDRSRASFARSRRSARAAARWSCP